MNTSSANTASTEILFSCTDGCCSIPPAKQRHATKDFPLPSAAKAAKEKRRIGRRRPSSSSFFLFPIPFCFPPSPSSFRFSSSRPIFIIIISNIGGGSGIRRSIVWIFFATFFPLGCRVFLTFSFPRKLQVGEFQSSAKENVRSRFLFFRFPSSSIPFRPRKRRTRGGGGGDSSSRNNDNWTTRDIPLPLHPLLPSPLHAHKKNIFPSSLFFPRLLILFHTRQQ